jgi:hypothetical protein
MQPTPDEVLIGRIAYGDRLAMQVLYARYHVRVFRFVVRLVRDEATAEDVISEVFLDVWRQADRFEGRSTVSTWLLAIARFKAISALRRRRDEELDEEAAVAIEDLSDNPATASKARSRVLASIPASRLLPINACPVSISDRFWCLESLWAHSMAPPIGRAGIAFRAGQLHREFPRVLLARWP